MARGTAPFAGGRPRSPEQGEEVQAIGVAEEDALLVVAALGDAEPESGWGESVFAGQVSASVLPGRQSGSRILQRLLDLLFQTP